jgi:hypothetical protein
MKRLKRSLDLAKLLLFALPLSAPHSCAIGAEAMPPSQSSGVAAQPSQGLSYDLVITDGELVSATKRVNASLANVSEVLREIYPDANIALSPGVRDIAVQDLKLRGARIEDALEAIRIASSDEFQWRKAAPVRPGGMDPSTGMPLPPGQEDSLPLFLLERDPTPAPIKESQSVEVFNMRGYLDSLNVTNRTDSDRYLVDLQRIVFETVDSLANRREPAGKPLPSITFRWHEGASLLIAMGPVEALQVARQVFTALPGVFVSRQSADPAAGRQSMSEEAKQAFLRRYGLARDTASPQQSQEQPGMSAEMRKRYGLAPATPERQQKPATPGQRP